MTDTYTKIQKARAARQRRLWWSQNRDDVILGGFTLVLCALIALIPIAIAFGH